MQQPQVKQKINNALDNGVAAVRLIKSHESQHSESFNRNIRYGGAAAILTGVFAIASVFAIRRAVYDFKKHQQWKHLDEQLDRALSESLDASDPVSLY